MNKICTTVDQAKKLIELGINVNTADMIHNILGEPYVKHDTPIDKYHTPAWSLSALLGLIPNGEKNDENYVDTESHSDFYICTYRNCWDGCIHSEYSEENLLDAVFGMVCWLLENNEL